MKKNGMGAFFGSIHVRTTNHEAVRKNLARVAKEADCKFLVGPVLEGWISAFPFHRGQDNQISAALANLQADDLFHLIVHDDDIFSYSFYRGGRLVDEYNSYPDYFEAVSGEQKQQWKGHPELFKDLLRQPGSLGKLKALLTAPKKQFTFES